MTTLTATAVITAVDRASAVFARVGANAARLGGRFAAATGAVSRFGNSTMASLGMPAAMAGVMSANAQYDIDRTLRLMQSAGELTDQQRKILSDSAYEASRVAGLSALDVIKGQRELIQGGFDTDTAARSSTFLSKVAKSNGMEMDKVAEDAINVANGLGLAMGTTEQKVASLRKTMEFMSVVPSLSTENWEGLRTSLKYAGPVAGALKIEMTELGAALSILADSGFKGEEGGTAFRTGMLRAIAPTRKARMELRAAGIDLKEMYDVDNAKVGDMKALQERLAGAGLDVNAKTGRVLSGYKNPEKFEGLYDYIDDMRRKLAKNLGIKRGDAESMSILNAAINQHVLASVTRFDLPKFMAATAKLPITGMKELFGIQRYAQLEQLRKKMNELVDLPTGERISRFEQLRREFERLMDGAIERRFDPLDQGYAASLDRISSAFGNMSNKVFESGFGGQLSGVFENLSNSINSLASTDPEKLQKIGWGLTALMTAPLLGAGPAGLAALALAFTDLGKAFQGQFELALGPNGEVLNGLGASPISNLMTELRALLAIDPRQSTLGTGFISLADSIQKMANFVKTFREAVTKYQTAPMGYQTGDPFADVIGDFKDFAKRKLFGEQEGRKYHEVPNEGLGPLSLLPNANPELWNQRLPLPIDRMSLGAGLAPMLPPPQPVTVTGSFLGEITNKIQVEYVGPIGGTQLIEGRSSVAGRLNPGTSSLDLEWP